MRNERYIMRDPTSEHSPTIRQRVTPPSSLAGCTVGVLSISKERSDEFLDTVAAALSERGIDVVRYTKPTHTKPAPEPVLAQIVEQCDVVVEGLAD